MADTDPLTLFPSTAPASAPAPASAANGGSGKGAASEDDPLKLFPSTPPKEAAATKPGPGVPSQEQQSSELGLPLAGVPAGTAPPALSLAGLRTLLQPAPNTAYDVAAGANYPWTPVARDLTTGQLRVAMPSMLRDPLLEAVGGGPQGGPGVVSTVDPATGRISTGLSPSAQVYAGAGANPLQFAETPLLRGPQSGLTLTKPPPVTLEELNAAIGRADQQPPRPETAPPAVPSTAGAPTGGPQPVGAQVTMPGAARLSPDEVNAYRATAEGKKLLENQVVGEPDRNAYVTGSNPNLAEQEQTVNTARELKSLGITSAEASNDAKLAAQRNNDARKAYWEDTARSPVDVQKAEAARSEQATADLKATWANKTDADASNVADTADQILAGPEGKQRAVRTAVQSVKDNLYDAKGNLETDPEVLYGVRKDINDMLSKQGQQETPTTQLAQKQLVALRDQLDTTIEAAAPGFKQYLKNFSDASRPIDEMHVLQDIEPKLFRGPGSTMTYSDFQRFMKNVVDMRGTSGVNPYKSITDETMQRLWNLRDDLRRSAGAQELARAPGSDTASNIIDAIKQYGKLGGGLAMDAGASHLFGPVAGPMISRGLRAVTAPIIAQRTARQQMGRMQEMLYPSNPLTPPGGSSPLSPP